MPQEADVSGLIWLIWIIWIFWFSQDWLRHQSSMEQREKESQQRDLLESAISASTTSPPAEMRISGDLEAVVSEILRREGNSTLDNFLAGALTTYERVVTAFNSGDRVMLRRMVSDDVYKVFSDAIESRGRRQKSMKTVFSRTETPEIVDGLIDDTHMEISMRFVGESFELPRDGEGQAAAERVTCLRTTDIWTFGRGLSARPATWRVIGTEAAAS